MYDPNQMNSLYFYPHKLHFSPKPDAADSEQRNRWFPGYNASTPLPRAKAPLPRNMSFPAVEPQASDEDRPAEDDVRVDDDGAPRSSGDDG
ncbi:hypothetical protein [Dyella kyungheensis]|uniref:Uncharacterized protein n=1 Tax=Dyella kyungheensis TaxID=1242174 RepID=A0ABS2JSL4_9GAMM|nr:hypothetical protein [Dyella kyungheensis]MBM7121453.1 hypothetical protein [Dyella kyungheensis]